VQEVKGQMRPGPPGQPCEKCLKKGCACVFLTRALYTTKARRTRKVFHRLHQHEDSWLLDPCHATIQYRHRFISHTVASSGSFLLGLFKFEVFGMVLMRYPCSESQTFADLSTPAFFALPLRVVSTLLELHFLFLYNTAFLSLLYVH
jgi:hypothetical protein